MDTSSLLSVAMSVSSVLCECVVCVSSLGPPPLTFSNVRTTLIKIPARLWGKWDKESDSEPANFQDRLCVSVAQQKVIGSKYSQHSQRVSASIEHYLLHSPHPSWRSVICSIDGMGESHIADPIRDWAEPLKGQTEIYMLL